MSMWDSYEIPNEVRRDFQERREREEGRRLEEIQSIKESYGN